MRNLGISFFLCLVAVIIFVLAALNVTFGSLDVAREIALGLAFGFASFLTPRV